MELVRWSLGPWSAEDFPAQQALARHEQAALSGQQYQDPAEARAREFFRRLLTAVGREEYDRTGYVTLRRDDLGRRYRIGDGRAGYTTVLVSDGDGVPLESWCAYVASAPRHDTYIAQLLLLRDDPEKLRRMAVVRSLVARSVPAADQSSIIGSGRDLTRVYRLLERAGYGGHEWLRTAAVRRPVI